MAVSSNWPLFAGVVVVMSLEASLWAVDNFELGRKQTGEVIFQMQRPPSAFPSALWSRSLLWSSPSYLRLLSAFLSVSWSSSSKCSCGACARIVDLPVVGGVQGQLDATTSSVVEGCLELYLFSSGTSPTMDR